MSETKDLRAGLDEALREGLERIAAASDLEALEEARIRVLGRKAALSRARAGLRDAPAEQKPELGKLANEVHSALELAIAQRRERFQADETERRWARDRIDVSLPGDYHALGSIHPLTRLAWELVDICVGLGFRLAEGPEVELTSYNFDALNTPPTHPSRSPQDTYYIAGRDDVVLRTHTSPVQIRTMEAHDPPVYVVAPGRCYRRDEQDATHLNSFVQIEGLAVDENITMGDLKGVLLAFARAVFGRDLDIRLRPSFFPFTEPSAEMDVMCFNCKGKGCRICKQEGWIELLGCGMVDPYLLERVGYDPERYTGFAFGCGVERIASVSQGVGPIRAFWENDLRFLAQFGGLT